MSEFTHSYALVIGINDYINGISSLQTAVNDATEIAHILETEHDYTVTLLRDGEATLSKLRQVLEIELPQQIQKGDRFLFYFAGHGIALNGEDGPEGYLIPQNAKFGKASTYLRMSDVNQALLQLPCRHFLGILDCCFAGAFRWSSTRKAIPMEQGTIHKERYDRFIQDPAWQVLTSASHDQTALDAFNLKDDRGQIGSHSPFASALIEALEGKADAFPPAEPGKPAGDGVITATDLYVYLRDRVEIATEARAIRQTPGIHPLKKHDKGEYIFLTPGHALNLPPAPPLDVSKNPYRGLSPFQEEHHKLFFGRSELIEKLQNFVKTNPLTVVLGASGAGKSSLVKAGLIPELRKEKTEKWYFMPPIRPGKTPLQALNNALKQIQLPEVEPQNPQHNLVMSIDVWAKKFPNFKLLLFVDQSEEIITLCQDEDERKEFFQQILQAINAHRDKLRVVLSLRSDFEPQVRDAGLKFFPTVLKKEVGNTDTELKKRWLNGRFIVPAMTRAELRQAIEKPAEARVMYFHPHDLVEQLINEVADMPGALPLLSFALSELYLKYLKRQRDAENGGLTIDRALTQADYQALGGVILSLTQRADEEYQALVQENPAYQRVIRHVMLRMVALGGGELARRQVQLSELEYPPEKNSLVKEVMERFSTARLLVKGQDAEGNPYVEPAHDALVRGWERLLKWKQEEQESLLLQRRLTPAAREWNSLKNKDKEQPKGILDRADPVLDWLDGRLLTIENLVNKIPAQFARLLRRAQNQQAQSREKPVQFLWNANPYLDVLDKELKSDDNWLNHVEAEFVQESVLQKRQNSSWRWRIAIAVMLGLSALTIAALIGQRNAQIGQVSASRASAEANFRINEQLNALVDSLRSSKNIKQIFLPDNDLHSQVGQTLRNMFYGAKERDRWEAPPGIVFRMFFTRKRQLLVITSENNKVRLWNKYGKPIAELQGQEGLFPGGISVSPDGSKIATATQDGILRLWDLKGKKLTEFKAHQGARDGIPAIEYIRFSPDGNRIATTGKDNSVSLWDLQGKKIRGGKLPTSSIIGLGLKPSGELRIATLDTDKDRIKVLDLSNQNSQEVAAFKNTFGTNLIKVSFSPNAKQAMIFYGEESENASLWNFSEPGKLENVEGRISRGGSFSPDGNKLAATGVDGTVNFLNEDAKVQSKFKLPQGRVKMSTFSPDGKQIATLGDDNNIRLWDLEKQPLSKPKLVQNRVESISFSSDGRTIATADSEGVVRLLDLQGNQIKKFTGLPKATSVSFSPNGQTIATTGDGGMVRLLDLQGKVVKKFQAHPGKVTSVSWSQDGQKIATIGDGGANNPDNESQTLDDTLVRLWDTKGNQLEEKKQEIFTNTFQGVSFQSNGKPLLLNFVSNGDAGATYSNVDLLDFSGNLTNLIPGRQAGNEFGSVKISYDGSLLLTTSGNTIGLWNLKGEKLMEFSSDKQIKSLSLSPDNSMLAVIGEDGTTELWRLGEFDELLSKGCDRVRDYLENNPNVSKSDRHLCDDVPK
ncbi:caspase family protein [Microcoleus sp. B5-D4]|uniref:nSTAND1 domain-containing NTPase n=1 Tax=unclassified Microcoleus TaxID=2642155 RepID=UPI002FCF0199